MTYLRWCFLSLIIFLLWSLTTTTFAAPRSLSASNQKGETFRIFPDKPCHVPEASSAFAAEHVAPDGKRTPGCFIESNGMLHFRFDDGDYGRAPMMLFKPDIQS